MDKKIYNIAVIGGGGREHAIIKSIKKSPLAGHIYALPGNGGIAADAECVPVSATDTDGIVSFCTSHPVDYVIVAPDDPLVLGTVDRLNREGIPCFGPTAAAAAIEGSKRFAKDLMKRYNIPTARYEVFTDYDKAVAYLKDSVFPIVIKADGLALGKGVIIATSFEEGRDALRSMMINGRFGKSGATVVIEEFLTGPEVSVLSFTDGTTVIPMISSMDHKRAFDNDQGPNTGGMGTIAPNPFYTPSVAEFCMKNIFVPTIEAMKKEGREFRGCLYFGLMLTPKGPKVIEYNCRFGDPETQVVLPLLDSDLLEVMLHTTEGTLSDIDVEFSSDSCCCVIYASNGYPGHYDKGCPIELPEAKEGEVIYVAGASLSPDGELLSNGGRVLGCTAKGFSLSDAVANAYALTERVSFTGGYYRHDIGGRALTALQNE